MDHVIIILNRAKLKKGPMTLYACNSFVLLNLPVYDLLQVTNLHQLSVTAHTLMYQS